MSHVASDISIDPPTWDAVGEYLQQDRVRLLSDARLADLREQWNDVTAQEASLDDAILIGLVGGTGVGKSTIINALAGEKVSRSGDRRPTTSRVVIYRYSETELPDDVPLEDIAQPQVLHSREALTKVILFDFPDFDSAESSHAEILQRYLPHLDVLFVVVDDMKYADLALYQLLRRLDHDAQNMFALFNKVDKLDWRYPGRADQVEADLLADFRAKLANHAGIVLDPSHQFAIAAHPVLEMRLSRASGGSRAAPFDERARDLDARFTQIEALVAQYQQAKHRRAAKERNLDARKSRLITELRDSAIGPENEAMIRESQSLVQTWRNELSKSLAAISTEVFSDTMRRGVRKTRLRREGAHWGVPVSLIMTLLTEMIGRGRSEGVRQPSELGARFYAHYQPFFQSLQNLQQRISAEFVGSAIAPQTREHGDMRLRSESVTLEAARAFQAEMEQKSVKPRRLSKWATHAPPLTVLGLAIWSRIYPILASASGESERGLIRSIFGALISSLSPTFLILTAVAVVLAYFATAFWLWLRVIHRTDANILEGEAHVRDRVSHFGDKMLGSLDAQVHELHQEFTQLDRLLS